MSNQLSLDVKKSLSTIIIDNGSDEPKDDLVINIYRNLIEKKI
jgi:hypothetical protein